MKRACLESAGVGAGKVGPVGKSGFAGDCTSLGKAGVIQSVDRLAESGAAVRRTGGLLCKTSLSGKQAGNRVKQVFGQQVNNHVKQVYPGNRSVRAVGGHSSETGLSGQSSEADLSKRQEGSHVE